MFLTLRIVGMNYATTEMSKHYLMDNCGPILKRANPMKDKLIDSIN